MSRPASVGKPHVDEAGGFTLMRTGPLVLLAAVSVTALWLAPRLLHPNRLVVRNSGGSDIGEVHVLLRHNMDGRVELDRTLSRLRAGASVTFKHGLNDSEASIEFRSGGIPRRFETGYIDLWRGEGWVLEIQADGSVKQGYDHPGFELR